MRRAPKLDVDAVLCISLKERADRRAALLQAFAPLGLDIEFMLAERHPGDPEQGCYESHQRCAAIALERGARRVLVLEDDATLEPFDGVQIARINRFLALRNPKLFHLGGIVGRMWRIPFPGVVRCRLTGTHAYVLSADACRTVVGLPFDGHPIDTVLPRRFRGYCTYPMLCLQQPEDRVASDIASHRSNRLAGDAAVKDAAFWQRNRELQHESVRSNRARTWLLRWL